MARREVLMPPLLPDDWKHGDPYPKEYEVIDEHFVVHRLEGMEGGLDNSTILDHEGSRDPTAEAFFDAVLNAKTKGGWGRIKGILGL